jgi:hypothetical protein
MRFPTRIAIAAALAIAGTIAFAVGTDPIEDARAPAPVVFVCRNGVAMSVWSAAYFNRLAAERGLNERAAARASIPSYRAVPLSMRLGLALDGFRLDGFEPHVIDAADARAASLVVAIDTELPPDARADASRTEVWDGFPPMREQYFPSRAALESRVEALVERLDTRRSR